MGTQGAPLQNLKRTQDSAGDTDDGFSADPGLSHGGTGRQPNDFTSFQWGRLFCCTVWIEPAIAG